MARAVVLNGMVETAVVVVPAPAMVATGHLWASAGLIAVALAVSAVQDRLRIRAGSDRQLRLLQSAEHAWNLGADPGPVIRAVQRDEPPPDDQGGDEPWYHRPPRRH